MSILYIILLIGFISLVHETGHFLFARKAKVHVMKFNIGLNFGYALVKLCPMEGKLKLFTYKDTDKNGQKVEKALLSIPVCKPWEQTGIPTLTWRDTVYTLGWLPVLSYVAVEDRYALKDEDGNIPYVPSWSLSSKSAWKRFKFASGGVFFNFLAALILFSVVCFLIADPATLSVSGIADAAKSGGQYVVDIVKGTVTNPIGMFFTGDGIAVNLPDFQNEAQQFMCFAAFLSVLMGLFNMLPIPGLDGSRILLSGAELLTGKKLNEKARFNFDRIGSLCLYAIVGVAIFTFF